jgi:hypothetical protein
MTKPNYLVDVRWGGGVNCLGQQLEELLEFIELYSTSRGTIDYDLVRKIAEKFHCEILTEEILSNRRKDL